LLLFCLPAETDHDKKIYFTYDFFVFVLCVGEDAPGICIFQMYARIDRKVIYSLYAFSSIIYTGKSSQGALSYAMSMNGFWL
jgi:hypothetical protein